MIQGASIVAQKGDKKIPAEAGRIRGKWYKTPVKSVQSCPADQFHSGLLQVKIAGQNGFDVTRIRALLHRVVQFNHPAELIAVTILRVGQNKLRVVLRGHGINLRVNARADCEPEHNLPVALVYSTET